MFFYLYVSSIVCPCLVDLGLELLFSDLGLNGKCSSKVYNFNVASYMIKNRKPGINVLEMEEIFFDDKIYSSVGTINDPVLYSHVLYYWLIYLN